MNSYLFRNLNSYRSDDTQKKEEKVDTLIALKKNKDNFCTSMLEVEKFLCNITKARKAFCLYKLLK